jgi:hypothetical protein
LIKSEFNKVFGGFASISWGNNKNKYYADDKAFIFSLTNKSKHEQYSNKDSALADS